MGGAESQMGKPEGRIPFWDVMKGLGIIAVVLGHDLVFTREVNWYHLVIFIFVSGALFRVEKAQDFQRYVFHKLRTVWVPFCKYNVTAILLTNVFLAVGFYTTQAIPGAHQSQWCDKYELIKHCFQVVLTGEVAPLTGPSWFIVPFFMNLLFIGGICAFFRRTSVRIIAALLLSALGYALVRHQIALPFHCATAMAFLPFNLWGMCYRKVYVTAHRKGIFFASAVAAGAVLYYCETSGAIISWATLQLPSPPIFAAASVAGVYANILLSKGIVRVKPLCTLFAWLGRNSFHIMALHLLGFKIALLVNGMVIGEKAELMSYLGGGYTMMGLACLLLGLFVPILVVKTGQRVLQLTVRLI